MSTINWTSTFPLVIVAWRPYPILPNMMSGDGRRVPPLTGLHIH